MRRTKFVVAMLMSLMFVTILTGFKSRDSKIKEFLYEYGNTDNEQMYDRSRNPMTDQTGVVTGGSWDYKIKSLNITKPINTKDINGITYHFVKCKISYELTPKISKKGKWELARYLALVIEENGFGEFIVIKDQSREVVVMGVDKKGIKTDWAEIINMGEKMVK